MRLKNFAEVNSPEPAQSITKGRLGFKNPSNYKNHIYGCLSTFISTVTDDFLFRNCFITEFQIMLKPISNEHGKFYSLKESVPFSYLTAIYKTQSERTGNNFTLTKADSGLKKSKSRTYNAKNNLTIAYGSYLIIICKLIMKRNY